MPTARQHGKAKASERGMAQSHRRQKFGYRYLRWWIQLSLFTMHAWIYTFPIMLINAWLIDGRSLTNGKSFPASQTGCNRQRGRDSRETIIKGVGTNPFDFKRPSHEREWKERLRVGESQSLFWWEWSNWILLELYDAQCGLKSFVYLVLDIT